MIEDVDDINRISILKNQKFFQVVRTGFDRRHHSMIINEWLLGLRRGFQISNFRLYGLSLNICTNVISLRLRSGQAQAGCLDFARHDNYWRLPPCYRPRKFFSGVNSSHCAFVMTVFYRSLTVAALAYSGNHAGQPLHETTQWNRYEMRAVHEEAHIKIRALLIT